ncbi:MAG: hypothetical protein AB1758_35745, partial [Candidatus Eremiobacterota bacterium]
MHLIAPPLSCLVEEARRLAEGEGDPESLDQACVRAITFNRDSTHLLEHLAAGILRTRETHELLRQARAELAAQLEAVERIRAVAREGRRTALAEASRVVQSTAERLVELSERLSAEEAKEQRYAPMAEVDHFIKTGINVLNGHLHPVELESRFPAMIRVVQGLQQDVERFARLYDEPALVEPARAELETLQAALGAGSSYLREGTREPLEDCLKLLGRGATEVQRHLIAFDTVARRARHPFLEEVRRARERGANDLLPGLWNRVEAAFYHFERELQAARQFSLFPLLEEEWTAASAAVHELGASMTAAASLPEFALEPLEQGFD